MTPKFQKFRGKEKILKTSLEKQIFYKGTRTKKRLLDFLLAKFYAGDNVSRLEFGGRKKYKLIIL